MAFQFQSVRKILCLFSKILPHSPSCSLLDSIISLHWWLAANLSIISQFSFKLDEQTGLCRTLSVLFSIYLLFPPFFFPFKFRLDKWLHYCCGQIFYVFLLFWILVLCQRPWRNCSYSRKICSAQMIWWGRFHYIMLQNITYTSAFSFVLMSVLNWITVF